MISAIGTHIPDRIGKNVVTVSSVIYINDLRIILLTFRSIEPHL